MKLDTEIQRSEVIKKLSREFPKARFLDGSELGHGNCIITGECSYVDERHWDGEDKIWVHFDVDMYNPLNEDYEETTWILGVHIQLMDFADKVGLFCENIDGGTLGIFEN